MEENIKIYYWYSIGGYKNDIWWKKYYSDKIILRSIDISVITDIFIFGQISFWIHPCMTFEIQLKSWINPPDHLSL